jgi:Ankyrin repeat
LFQVKDCGPTAARGAQGPVGDRRLRSIWQPSKLGRVGDPEKEAGVAAMSFRKKAKRTAIVDRLVEEKLYEQVLREIEAGMRRDGLWAKALQKSRGNEQEAKALYIEYRVQSIKDEAEISAALSEQHAARSIEDNVKPIDTYDEDGYTPLMRAVKRMDIDEVVNLVEQGANPRIKDGNFKTSTALTMAKLLRNRAKTLEAQQGFQQIVDVLEPIT